MYASRSLQSPWQPQPEHRRQTGCHQTWWSGIPGLAKDNAILFICFSLTQRVFFNKQLCYIKHIRVNKLEGFFFSPVHKTPADSYPPSMWRMRSIYFSKLLNAHSISEKTNYSWECLLDMWLMTSPCKLGFFEENLFFFFLFLKLFSWALGDRNAFWEKTAMIFVFSPRALNMESSEILE